MYSVALFWHFWAIDLVLSVHETSCGDQLGFCFIETGRFILFRRPHLCTLYCVCIVTVVNSDDGYLHVYTRVVFSSFYLLRRFFFLLGR